MKTSLSLLSPTGLYLELNLSNLQSTRVEGGGGVAAPVESVSISVHVQHVDRQLVGSQLHRRENLVEAHFHLSVPANLGFSFRLQSLLDEA